MPASICVSSASSAALVHRLSPLFSGRTWERRRCTSHPSWRALPGTERATFREFGNLTGGVYETLRPSDEYRTLHRIGSTGWELHGLDGSVVEFDSDGLWLSTTDRNGNETAGTYPSGELVEVSFPDGRSEEFTYDGSGKLATVTEIGTDGTTERTWGLTWSGDDLSRIDQPDGTAWVMTYGDAAHPGYLTRLELEGTDGTSRRVETAWEYDAEGNAVKIWRGDVSFTGSDAVDRWAFSFDDPVDPTETEVTDPLGDVATYTYDRDPASEKPRLLSVDGDCPRCGLAANSTLAYEGTNPLLPTSVTDGNGNVTLHVYDADGRETARTEADGTAEERTTTWEYDTTYPALVTAVEQPSVEPGQVRRKEYDRDAAGNVTTQRIEGYEDGVPFSYETVMTYNAAGQVLTVDRDGHGTADLVSYGYDATGLVLTSRTDPLIGTTTYGHDAFNRRTSATDPNGVTTDTTYDDLDRVTHVIQRGAAPAGDLDTEQVYDVYGDLGQTVLPAGNVVVYDHDAAGRLFSVERAADLLTPGERSFYTLDGAGNRILEEQQSWDGSGWVTQSQTGYLYACRCHLDKVLHADGTVTEYAYECNGNLEKVWDANHPSLGKTATPTTTYAYDALDRLATVTRPWAGAGGGTSVTGYGYDAQDHLTSVTDGEGSETTYEYSDRDLLTEEVSPVAGTTSHVYDEHGELTATTDARMITVFRTPDPLDRVTFVDYPTDSLDTLYVYDDPGVAFSKGRLTAITRDGDTVAYAYDRFGRVTQDGDLAFDYDGNGNRTQIVYPGGVSADYTFDFADREATLSVTSGVATTPVVSAAGYLPAGPLGTLDLGSGAEETRVFDQRYFPVSIALAAERTRSWVYTTDAVGNVTEIAAAADCPAGLTLANRTVTDEQVYESCSTLDAGPAFVVDPTADVTFRAADKVVLHDGFAVKDGGRFAVTTDPDLFGDVTKTYGYQDVDYFLASADGPWGALGWTYDRIGNRLSETRNGLTDAYAYTPNASSGNTALLASISLGVGGNRTFAYTPAGHQTQSAASGNTVAFDYDDEGRLGQTDRPTAPGVDPVDFLYDGRSYLRQAGDLATTGTVHPTYDSAGLLQALLRQEGAAEPQRRYHFLYLAGRPVAQLATESGQPDRWWYLTTDHLGTPLVATGADRSELWENRFEPFGEDPWAGTPLGALEAEMFLRFPGQWEDGVWAKATTGESVTQNGWRWYQAQLGRYSRPDPLGLRAGLNLYHYAVSSPIGHLDPDGRLVVDPSLTFPFACSYVFASEARVRGRTNGWPWAHCWASCSITKACGGPTLARTMGLGKELIDVAKCLPQIFSSQPINPDGNCGSAFQPSDSDDNEFGITCPQEQSCEDRCRPLIGREETPGPLYAITIGARWYLRF